MYVIDVNSSTTPPPSGPVWRCQSKSTLLPPSPKVVCVCGERGGGKGWWEWCRLNLQLPDHLINHPTTQPCELATPKGTNNLKKI